MRATGCQRAGWGREEAEAEVKVSPTQGYGSNSRLITQGYLETPPTASNVSKEVAEAEEEPKAEPEPEPEPVETYPPVTLSPAVPTYTPPPKPPQENPRLVKFGKAFKQVVGGEMGKREFLKSRMYRLAKKVNPATTCDDEESCEIELDEADPTLVDMAKKGDF